jgi:hypothetical protein
MGAIADPHLALERAGVPLRPAHPVVRSFDPGESRRWCHADE